MAIEKILDLEQLEVNIYRGAVFSPESGFFQRTFGGHVAGQTLVSAVRTVDPKFQVHSLHGYFLRPGDAQAPTVFIVERLRDGGSFVTRRVNAIQHGETIFSMSASFQADQSGIEHQDAMPFAPPPDDLPNFISKGGAFDDAGFAQFAEWDVRIVPRDQLKLLPGKASQQQVWFRHRDPLPDDHVLHICALAYMSDLTLLGSAQVTPRRGTQAPDGCVAGSRDVVHAAVPRRRMASVRPVLAVVIGWPLADPGQDLHPNRRDGGGGNAGRPDSLQA